MIICPDGLGDVFFVGFKLHAVFRIFSGPRSRKDLRLSFPNGASKQKLVDQPLGKILGTFVPTTSRKPLQIPCWKYESLVEKKKRQGFIYIYITWILFEWIPMYNKPKMDPCIIGSRGIWILFVSFWTQVMSIVESQNFYEPSGINSVDASGIVVNVPWASTLGWLNFRQSMVRWAVTSWHLVISCV